MEYELCKKVFDFIVFLVLQQIIYADHQQYCRSPYNALTMTMLLQTFLKAVFNTLS